MITNNFVRLISNNAFQNTISNTTAQVSIETGLKAIGRPAFTLADSHVDMETRKYSAAKELLYQLLCLGIYLSIIPFVFKRGGFKVVKNLCNTLNKHPEALKEITKTKDKAGIANCAIDMFKNEKGLIALHNLGHLDPNKRNDVSNKFAVKLYETLSKNLDLEKAPKDFLEKVKNEKQNSDFFRQFYIGKGGIEISSIIGSVIGLTILAPEISHCILHPIMKALNLEPKHAKQAEQSQPKNETPKTDIKA